MERWCSWSTSRTPSQSNHSQVRQGENEGPGYGQGQSQKAWGQLTKIYESISCKGLHMRSPDQEMGLLGISGLVSQKRCPYCGLQWLKNIDKGQLEQDMTGKNFTWPKQVPNLLLSLLMRVTNIMELLYQLMAIIRFLDNISWIDHIDIDWKFIYIRITICFKKLSFYNWLVIMFTSSYGNFQVNLRYTRTVQSIYD